jgi:predicted lipoprotein with Yx(FWY)xxD motif
VLVDSSGHTLYTSEQEESGKIVCASSDCEAIWTPLTVQKGEQPTGPSDVAGKLGTVKRPDGSIQVTYKGGPLYTFTFDHSAGQVNGNGTKDSFDGTNFVWHAATATGAAVAPGGGSSSPDDSGGGYGY